MPMYSSAPSSPLLQYILKQNFVEAAISGDLLAIDDALKNYGLDVDQGKGSGRNPLAAAVCNDQLEAVKQLLRAGADVNTRYKGSTLLYIAFFHGNAELVRILVNAGADVTLLDETTGQLSIVDAAVCSGKEELVDFALSLAKLSGMDMARMHAEGLISAVSEKNTHLARKFIDLGADPDSAGPNACLGCPPLMFAADRKDAAMVKLLVEHGA